MGRDPLVLRVGEWTIEFDVTDHWTTVAIVQNGVTQYLRITPEQAHDLRQYLDDTLPALNFGY